MENNFFENFSRSSNSKSKIAGVLLIIAAILSIIMWITLINTEIKEDYVDEIKNTSYIKESNINLTSEMIRQSNSICGTIGIIISIFPILGGILAFKGKKWNFAIFSSIPLILVGFFIIILSGILIINLLLVNILLLIGIFLIYKSKKDFEK